VKIYTKIFGYALLLLLGAAIGRTFFAHNTVRLVTQTKTVHDTAIVVQHVKEVVRDTVYRPNLLQRLFYKEEIPISVVEYSPVPIEVSQAVESRFLILSIDNTKKRMNVEAVNLAGRTEKTFAFEHADEFRMFGTSEDVRMIKEKRLLKWQGLGVGMIYENDFSSGRFQPVIDAGIGIGNFNFDGYVAATKFGLKATYKLF